MPLEIATAWFSVGYHSRDKGKAFSIYHFSILIFHWTDKSGGKQPFRLSITLGVLSPCLRVSVFPRLRLFVPERNQWIHARGTA